LLNPEIAPVTVMNLCRYLAYELFAFYEQAGKPVS
jgi:hypothetical protein